MPVNADMLSVAVTVYKEARSEPRQCQILVAEVVRNRMDAENKTAKQVITKKRQFSWVPLLNGRTIESDYKRLKLKAKNDDAKALSNAVLIAQKVLRPNYDTGNNLFYFHSRKGKPYDVKCGKLYFSHRHK
jgi:hypothetical protein